MHWFRQTVEELRKKNLTDKMMKRTILTAVRYHGIACNSGYIYEQCDSCRTGLVKHPMDIRGSRRAFEAAKIFLTMDNVREHSSLLPTQIPKLPTAPQPSSCPTYPCAWALSKLCLLLSLCVSHPASAPVLVFILHFCIWCYELLTDVVFINNFWNFRIPIM